jgi:hypothetical protein
MLMYSGYRTTELYQGLVQDKGHDIYGFHDVTVLKHLCAKVTGSGRKTFIIDAPEMMEGHFARRFIRLNIDEKWHIYGVQIGLGVIYICVSKITGLGTPGIIYEFRLILI